MAIRVCQRPSRSPRWWPSKVPTGRSGCWCSAGSFLAGFSHAVAVAFGDDDDGVVQEPVEEAGGGGVFGKEPAPGFERPVRGDGERAAFVGGGHEPEQELAALEVEGCKAEFVDDHELGAQHVV